MTLKHSNGWGITQAYRSSSLCSLLIFMAYIKLIMETFQDVFKTCLLQVFVMYCTNTIPNVSFPFPYKRVKKNKCTMVAISRHTKNVSKHIVFSNVQNQANNWENNNKITRKALLRNFSFIHVCLCT